MKGLALCFLVAVAATASAQDFPVYQLKNKPMPKFSLVDTNGRPVTNASLKGKVYLMDFWATWCKPCLAAMPTMQKLSDKYRAAGLQVIGTNVFEYTENKNAAAAVKKKKGLTYTFTQWSKNAEQLGKSLKIIGIPTLILVDKKGVIRETIVGLDPKHEASLEKTIAALLKS